MLRAVLRYTSFNYNQKIFIVEQFTSYSNYRGWILNSFKIKFRMKYDNFRFNLDTIENYLQVYVKYPFDKMTVRFLKNLTKC